MDFIKEFDNAIKSGHIVAYYQPLTRAVTGAVCGAEALARWIDPNVGVIPPSEFISILEENRLIYKLDLAIIEDVCRFYNENKNMNLNFSVNLSRIDFVEVDMFSLIDNILKKYNVPSNVIHLEITESTMIQNTSITRTLFNQFHNAGFEIWIDDFGSGFSSLQVLREYDFDVLKIDMSIVKQFDTSSKKILYSIINMAKKLGMHSLAEGVEIYEQYQFLKNIGCEIIQGYYFSKPISKKEFLDYLKIRRIESKEDNEYWNKAGYLNFLSADPLKSLSNFNDLDIISDAAPLALIEFHNDKFKYYFINDQYRTELKKLGFETTIDLEKAVNDEKYENRESFIIQVKNSILYGDIQRVDNIINNVVFSHFTKLISKMDNKYLIASSINSISTKRTDFLVLKYSQSLYKTYDCVTEITPKEDSAVQIYSTAGFAKIYGTKSLREGINEFASNEVKPSDKERYLKFFDLDKIINMDGTYIQDIFLIRSGDSYKLKNVRISKIDNEKYLYTIQSI